jgi:hypothetical protein
MIRNTLGSHPSCAVPSGLTSNALKWSADLNYIHDTEHTDKAQKLWGEIITHFPNHCHYHQTVN